MPTEHEPLYAWVGACVDAARGADDPGRAAIRAAMQGAGERYDGFRYVVMHVALVRHLRQDPSEVRRILAVELGRSTGDLPSAPTGRNAEADGPELDELLAEGSREGRWPLAELVVLAGAAFDDPRSWAKLVAVAPDHPVAFFAMVVARHVHSRTRLGGSGAGGDEEVDFPDRGKQHVVAGMLDHLAAADPECGGCWPDAAGMYRKAMGRLVEHLAERGGEATYTLRKLFPHHAWPPETPTGRRIPAQALLEAVVARHGEALASPLAAALAEGWGASPPPTVRAGLDASAAWHDALERFPGWPEVALWSGDAAPGAPFNPNTLQRQVSRLDDELTPFLAQQHARLRRLVRP